MNSQRDLKQELRYSSCDTVREISAVWGPSEKVNGLGLARGEVLGRGAGATHVFF